MNSSLHLCLLMNINRAWNAINQKCKEFLTFFPHSSPHFCWIFPTSKDQVTQRREGHGSGTYQTQGHSSTLWSAVWSGILHRRWNFADLLEFTGANQKGLTGSGAPVLHLITTKWSTDLVYRASCWLAGRTGAVDGIYTTEGDKHYKFFEQEV